MAGRGRGRRGCPRGASQAPPVFDQQAFAEAVGSATTVIAQASAAGSQEGVDDIRDIQDMGAGTKRKEDSSSSNPVKKQKTSVSQGYPGQGQGYQGQGQDGTFSQAGQMMCYFCRQPGHFRPDCPRRQESQSYGTPQSQSLVRRVRVANQDEQMVCYHCQHPGHMRRDCPQRQGSQGVGTAQSQSAVGQERTRFVPPPPSMGQGNQYQFQGATPTPSTSQTGHIDQRAGRGRAKGLQVESSGQARQMMCYHCCQPRHMRRDCPRRQRSHGTETERSD